jgi:uncharacterized membrane protein
MTWLKRYRVRHFLGSSLWIFPVLSTFTGIGAFRLLHWIERDRRWTAPVDLETARVVLGTMASALFTAIVFICSALLVAVQLASAQLTPRIIGIVFRDPVAKLSLTLLAFTFTFTLATLIRITSVVPLLTTQVAAYDSLVSLGVWRQWGPCGTWLGVGCWPHRQERLGSRGRRPPVDCTEKVRKPGRWGQKP